MLSNKLSKSQLERILDELIRERKETTKGSEMRDKVNNFIVEYQLIYKDRYGVFYRRNV